MARYFIEDVKCGLGAGGMACGPVSGPVVAEVKVKDNNDKVFYLSLAEVDGFPNFFQTTESTYDMQVSQEMTDEDVDYLNDNYIDADVEGDYNNLFEMTEEDEELLPLLKYLTYIVRSDWDECKRYQKETKGKYLDEIEIPICDLEEEYLEENE